jgi:hypothetical protein
LPTAWSFPGFGALLAVVGITWALIQATRKRT